MLALIEGWPGGPTPASRREAAKRGCIYERRAQVFELLKAIPALSVRGEEIVNEQGEPELVQYVQVTQTITRKSTEWSVFHCSDEGEILSWVPMYSGTSDRALDAHELLDRNGLGYR